jgi:hypothetical protein
MLLTNSLSNINKGFVMPSQQVQQQQQHILGMQKLQQQVMQQPVQQPVYSLQAPPPTSGPGLSVFGSNVGGTAAPFGSSPFGSSLFGSSVPTGFSGAGLPSTVEAPAASQPDEDAFSNFEEITIPTPEPTTVVTESPLSVSYTVEGESTIPSDGLAHQVSVAVLSFESKVTYVCCPKIEARVYLQVRFFAHAGIGISLIYLIQFSVRLRTPVNIDSSLVLLVCSLTTAMYPKRRSKCVLSYL